MIIAIMICFRPKEEILDNFTKVIKMHKSYMQKDYDVLL